MSGEARVLAVNISAGGIPKRPQLRALVTASGLDGDGHNHAKHVREDRAISVLDIETIDALAAEGFAVVAGGTGENLTVEGLHVQQLPEGTLLELGEVVLRLEQPRKPCYVLDAIDPRLKEAMVGRCGYMASVVHGGLVWPGMSISPVRVVPAAGALPEHSTDKKTATSPPDCELPPHA